MEHGYRACLGLLALAKRFTRPRLEAACAVALELGTTNSSHVRDILINGRDQVQPITPDWTSPQHAHVRGPGYLNSTLPSGFPLIGCPCINEINELHEFLCLDF